MRHCLHFKDGNKKVSFHNSLQFSKHLDTLWVIWGDGGVCDQQGKPGWRWDVNYSRCCNVWDPRVDLERPRDLGEIQSWRKSVKA